MLAPYRRLLRIPGALRFSVAGFIARMPMSMDALALIFIVYHASHSYTLAGILAAVGEMVVMIALPFWARTADRIGQRKTLTMVIPARAIFLIIFVLLLTYHAPTWTWFLSIITVEASVINAGGLVRRRWGWVLKEDRDLLNTAYSYEGLMDEFIFIFGPVIATFCATLIAPSSALLVGLVFMVAGSIVFASQKDSEPPPHPRNEEKPHPAVLRNRAIQAVMLPVAFLGAFFSAVGLVVVAFAREHDAVGRTGVLLAAWAFGSAIAAFVNGSIKWKKNYAHRFWIFFFALISLSTPFLFVTNFTFLIIALFLNGLAIAPLMVAAYGVAESVVPQEQVTETLAWVFIALPIGGAVASSLTGWVIDKYGADAGLIIPLASLTCGLLASLPYFRTWNRLRSAS